MLLGCQRVLRSYLYNSQVIDILVTPTIDATFVPSSKPSSKPTLLDTVYRIV